jgi:hypothetical protein
MWLSGQWFGSELVERIAAAIASEPAISRSALSRQVCEWLEWRAPDGKLREVGCRKALLELARRGVVQLPDREEVASFKPAATKRRSPPEVAEVRCSLDELGEVAVVPVTSRYSKSSEIWNGLMETSHYLGAGPLCGAQVRYLVRCSNYGWLGALSFSAATWRLQSRDKWIGWSEGARVANLQQVVCNSRFLIAPSVEVPNLASHVLAKSVHRLVRDWQERYGYKPALVETFVDGQRFAGTCYRAANWKWVGQTAGRADGYSNGKRSTGKKEIYVYPLRRDWRNVLCYEPDDRLVPRTPTGEAGDWVEEEFAGARIYDERLRRRLYTLARDLFGQPGVLIPQACSGSVAKTKAAYRFFDNKRVGMEPLLRGHVEATAQRVSQHEVVLAVQDTTTLNYTAHPATNGLGPINTKKDHGVGLILHDTMAFSTEGTPLGLIDVQCWARDPEEAGKKSKRKELPIEQKESMKWLRSYRAAAEVQELCSRTLLISVGDREADIHELFHEAQKTPSGPKLLIRAERSRLRKVGEEEAEAHEFLWEKLPSEPVAGHQEVFIPRKGSRASRTARLEVRYAPVTLKPPKGKDLAWVPVWAVYAREIDSSAEVKSPLEWMLLTTVEVRDFEEALERLRWYTLRWGIEVYHRVLKSGCRIEDRQLGDAARIESCLAIDLVVAWRIFWLTKQGRETPDVPCDVFLEEEEWKALCATVREAAPPAEPPTLRDAVRMIASLGGFLGRNRDGEPGTTTLWRGIGRLDDIVIGYRAARRTYEPNADP